ncbi:MAG TPA: DNA methyltransferase [Polyangiales bacterium]|nr:DNA methyltransferase [Polyangiales bacterium]
MSDELPTRPRRSLSQRGGEISGTGDSELSAQLTAAIESADAQDGDDLTHGFHTYPARMHPALARELLASSSEPGDLVLDPFCGSGTVLVEACVAGCRPQGVDLNPLALRIAEVHCDLRDKASRARFAANLTSVADASTERVQTRTKPRVPISREEQAMYEPHVMLELSGLFEEIERVTNDADRRALAVVFSALLVKFSRKKSDTSTELVTKRIRKGLVTEFFVRKGRELSLRWEALYENVPRDPFRARLIQGDARHLRRALGAVFTANLVLTSPPYGGTYDYAHQHALRNAWFGLDSSAWEAEEIGARRNLADDARGVERWNYELRGMLRSIRRVLANDGRLILWLGDADVSGRRIAADQQIARLAPEADFELLASATQARRDARGGAPRGEHLLLLEPR